MTQPLVSIVIPTYNREHLLRQVIENVLEQTYQNIEILVIDDGSRDGTKDFMQNYSHPKLSYSYKANGGPSTARNEGIRRAKGDYIAFMDSDDLWDPAKVEEQVIFLEANPEMGMVTTNYRFIDDQGKTLKDPGKERGYVAKNGFIRGVVEITFPIATTSTFTVRKSVFETIGMFDERLGISEDLDLWVRIGLKYSVGYLDDVLVSVRLHENHLMRETPRYEVWQRSIAVLESHRSEIIKQIPDADVFFAKFFELAGDIALHAGLRFKALCFYLKALKRDSSSFKKYRNILKCILPMQYLLSRYERSIDKNDNRILQKYR